MSIRRIPAVLVAGAMGVAAVSQAQAPQGQTRAAMAGVTDPAQAHVDYMLHCQGCHRPDGTGDDRSAPPLRGWVSRFLLVPGGREFLGRVPGVATTPLSDARLANLMNWVFATFDPQHMPADFRPYGAAEIGRLRKNPLRLERAAERARLEEAMPK